MLRGLAIVAALLTAAPAAAEPRCSEREISATGAPGRIHFSARRNARLAWSAKVRAELGSDVGQGHPSQLRLHILQMAIPLQRHGAPMQIFCIRQAIARDPKQRPLRPLAATARTAYKAVASLQETICSG
jgi:hypothetical protein